MANVPMDVETRSTKMLRFGLLIQRIALLSDDKNLKRIKPTLDELEKELENLFNQLTEV